MARKLSHDIKETAIAALRDQGTMQYAAEICGVSVRVLNEEMRRSEIFKRRVLEAREEGKRSIADKAIELIKSYAYGENTEKTDRNRLTAAIALANAYEPGFRGITTVQGKIEHNFVRTAIPRPRYEELPAPERPALIAAQTQYERDKAELEILNRGKPVNTIQIVTGIEEKS